MENWEKKQTLKKIVQIIPAENWKSVYFAGSNGELDLFPLAFWALVESEDGTRRVTGVEPRAGEPMMLSEGYIDLGYCEEHPNFFAYAGPETDINALSERARDLIETNTKRSKKVAN